jgi:tyrosyl-tRNA synthetase
MHLLDELEWRGLLHTEMPGTREQLSNENTIAYCGFDPTADSLHIGNLVPIILLMHLQKAGHTPMALIGGATGMVGDPSGKSAERNLLDVEILRKNEAGVKKQLQRFLDFNPAISNTALLVNNYDWFKNFNFLDFIRDVGKHITVNYMMAKDSVQKRLESGMSFTEFSYQLIQGYDFQYLNKNHNVKIQAAGSDQWGNIVTGTELIRRMSNGASEGFAFTCPLITKADGSKFGKSESGNVWLDANKTSPYKFYQFWLNISDVDAEKYIKIFTFLSQETINSLIAIHNIEPHLKTLQIALAKEVTDMVHSNEATKKAIATSHILFGANTTEALKTLNEQDLLEALEGVPQHNTTLADLETKNIIELLTGVGIFPSKTEARKSVAAGALSINKIKTENVECVLSTKDLIASKYVLIGKGKKNNYLLIVS